MLLQAINYAVDPLRVHDALHQNSLTSAADHAAELYNAQEPHDRELSQAMAIGAMRGAALSRRMFGAATGVSDAMFGAKLSLAPGFDGGVVPKLLALPNETIGLTFARAASRVGGAVAATVMPPLTARLAQVPLNAAEASFLGSQVGFFTTTLMTMPLTLASTVGIISSYWTSAAIKLAAAAPLALSGAVVGAALHQLRVAPAQRGGNMGPRGERNDETFAFMEPTTSIPDAYFFLTEDRFGLDIRELVRFAIARGSLINPHTNTAFSSQDNMRLRAALPRALGAGAPTMLGQPSLLSKDLWVKNFDTFVSLASSLGQTGANSAHHRALGCEGVRQLLMIGDPIEMHALKLFVETMMQKPWTTTLVEIEKDPSAAQNFAANLLKMCQMVGAAALGLSAKAESVAEFISRLEAITKKEKEAANIYLALRNPWLAQLCLDTDELNRVHNPIIPGLVVENQNAR